MNHKIRDKITAALKLQRSGDTEESLNGGSELFDILGEHATNDNPLSNWDISPSMKTNFVAGLLKHLESMVEIKLNSKDTQPNPENELCMIYDHVGVKGLKSSQLKRLFRLADNLCKDVGNVVQLDNGGNPYKPSQSLTEFFVGASRDTGKQFKGSSVSTHFFQSSRNQKVAVVITPDNHKAIIIVDRNCMLVQDLPALNSIAK